MIEILPAMRLRVPGLVWLALVICGWARPGLCGPRGDSFADPIVMVGDQWAESLSVTNATAEPGESSHYSARTSDGGMVAVPPRSVWLSWSATRTGVAQVMFSRRAPLSESLVRNEAPPRLVIYVNPASVSARPLVAGTTFGRSPHQLIRFVVTSGQSYRFVFSGTEAWDGEYLLALTVEGTQAPPNDHFDAAETLEAGQLVAHFDLEYATLQEGEPGFGHFRYLVPPSGVFGGGNTSVGTHPRGGSSVWFRWVAPEAGGYSISASAPGATPQLGVWRSDGAPPRTVEDLRSVAQVENGGNDISTHTYYPCEWCWPIVTHSAHSRSSETATAAFQAQSGDEFWFQLDRVSTAPFWDAQIFPEIEPWSPTGHTLTNCNLGVVSISRTALNDSFAHPLPLSGIAPETAVNAGATFEPGEPLPALLPPNFGSFWWSWTAPTTGLYLVGSSYTEVLRGETLANLMPLNVDATDAFPGTFSAAGGEVFLVRSMVAASEARSLVNPVPIILAPVANDAFAGATEIPEYDGRVLNQPPSALTLEPGEAVHPAFSTAGSCWFKLPSGNRRRILIPPQLLLEDSPAGTLQRMRLFAGSTWESLAELQPVSSSSQGSIFELAGGQEHRLQLLRPRENWRFPFQVHLEVSPRHDRFAERRAVAGNLTSLGGSVETSLLTAEPGEPHHAGVPPRNSAWYEWTAPAAGTFFCDFTGPAGSRLALYRGSELHALQPLQGAVRGSGLAPERLHFQAGFGEKLVLAYDAPDSHGLAVFSRGLDHDFITSARDLAHLTLAMPSTPASLDELEQSLFPDATAGVLWHRLAASSSGIHTLEVMLTGVEPRAGIPLPELAIFSGSDPESLAPVSMTPISRFSGRRAVNFTALAGQTYFIAVIPRGSTARYDLGLTGETPAQGPLRLWRTAATTDAVLGIRDSSRFIHRLERSANLSDWQPVQWLDSAREQLVDPIPHLSAEGHSFFRLVGP